MRSNIPTAITEAAPDSISSMALKALQVSESRYRRLFETARDGILLLNADTGRIEDVNPYLIELLGYSHVEFLGKMLWEVGTFADIVESQAMFTELQTTGYVRYEDLPLRTKTGSTIAVEFISNAYVCEGVKVIQCNIRNISERKRAQNLLRESEIGWQRAEIEVRNQRALIAHQGRLVLLGELASALAHEINQPLTAITGFAASCARKCADNPAALELVRAIEEQAMRAGDIIWRMRGFARRQRLGCSALSLPAVVGGVVKWIRLDSKYPEVIIDVTGLDPALPQVDADRVELEQVLVNLVRNGIEATLPGIMQPRIAISGRLGAKASEVEVSVTDWGCGMPAAAALEVFQPFTSFKEQGLGLGLTICFSIIEGHGGRLWATANPAGGTIFHFTLPVAGIVKQGKENHGRNTG